MKNVVPPDIEGYRYIRSLGRGGFADVYLYEQAFPQRDVAVKVLRHDVDETFRDRFAEEANMMARVSTHPSIVTILGAAVSADARPYLVMEYCPYKHMGERAKEDPLSVAEALKTGIQIAGAVESAHRLGIIHRDIKPANILVTAYRHPALTDFGISVTGDRSASVGVSVPWAPPEQVDGAPATVRADVYSLAATIYHLLAGHSPFGGTEADKDLTLMAERVVSAPVPPIGRPDVPPAFEQVLVKAMSKDPEDRYGSAIELARALQRVQHEIGLQVTQIEAMDQAVPPQAVHYEDDGQTVIVSPKAPDEAPARWSRDGEFGSEPLVDSGQGPPTGQDQSTQVRTPEPDQDTDRTRLRVDTAPTAGAGPRRRRRLLIAGAAGAAVLISVAVGGTWIALNTGQQRGGGVSTPSEENTRMTMGSPIGWRNIAEGNCIEKVPEGDRMRELVPTWCNLEHEGYLVFVREFSQDEPYPGPDVLGERIIRSCEEWVKAYNVVNGLEVDDYVLKPLAPGQNAWESTDYNDRTYGCLASRADGALMTGSLSGKDLKILPNPSASAQSQTPDGSAPAQEASGSAAGEPQPTATN